MADTYRKKPVVIHAWQIPTVAATMAPDWVLAAILDGRVQMVQGAGARIHTLEGVMTAEVGDWIIQGVKHELYPCKPDIFAATYEEA